MHPRHLRAVRGASAAGVATLLAATSHTLAGGGAPGPALVFALAVLTTPIAVAVVGRRLSAWRVSTAVLASQALFHTAFAMTAGITVDGNAAAHASSHLHHGLVSFDASSNSLVLPDAPMLFSHLMAAALTVVALYFGERMLRSVADGIRSILARAHVCAPLDLPALRTGAPAPSPVRVGATVLSDVSRRGPPAFVTTTL